MTCKGCSPDCNCKCGSFHCGCPCHAEYSPPTTRAEALDEVMRTGATISALLAVADAFPLIGEREYTVRALRKWAKADPEFVAGLITERNRYIVSWGLTPSIEGTP